MITLKNTTKTYELNKNNSVTAIEDITLHIEEGELVVLKGVSGSGKSTVLSLIAALTKPSSGEVLVDEQRVSKLPDNFAADYRQKTIGFIFQKYNLIPTISVQDNILLPLVPTNPDEKLAREKLDRVLEQFNISDKKETIVRNLSGGEQQRVAIARALINDPKVIIADEPTANLDEQLSQDFIAILQGLKDEGKTIVVATHDPLFFDLDIVDRVIEMKRGRLL
ncbi:MAG: ABC transporter ATP-binding protein [Epsilonproteobacteria bacterium]|nr:ABC transporter ATP-binding protein [Campylobacterota bacterium]